VESIPPGAKEKTRQLDAGGIPVNRAHLGPRTTIDPEAIYKGSLGGYSI